MKKTILIAEDDKKLSTALTARLEAAGYEVMTAPDGFRGFMLAVSRRPDLVLMDISMPYGDGLSLAEELKKADLENIPIIFMTASTKKSLWARAQEIGAAGFFQKPFDAQKLLNAIARVFNASSTGPHSLRQSPA